MILGLARRSAAHERLAALRVDARRPKRRYRQALNVVMDHDEAGPVGFTDRIGGRRNIADASVAAVVDGRFDVHDAQAR